MLLTFFAVVAERKVPPLSLRLLLMVSFSPRMIFRESHACLIMYCILVHSYQLTVSNVEFQYVRIVYNNWQIV